MSTAGARLEDDGQLRVEVPLGWLVALTLASVAGATTTVLALEYGPAGAREQYALARTAMRGLGTVRGMVLFSGLKVLAVVVAAQIGATAAAPLARRDLLPAWYPLAVEWAVYGGATAWFGWLAVHNLTVIL